MDPGTTQDAPPSDRPGITPAETAALRRAPGVAQVEPFGTALHVTGPDPEALDAAIAAAGAKGVPADTSLEDVFIRLMDQSQDNVA